MKRRNLKDLSKLKLTKNVIIPFPNFQQNTIISPTQMNDNFEEIEYAYNNLIDNHNGAIQNLENAINSIPSKEELKGEKGDDGLTTSITVNGVKYIHNNGDIALPNYYTKSEIDDLIGVIGKTLDMINGEVV